MTSSEFVQPVLDFVKMHEAWAVPIVFVLSFGESLAFISLLLPATVILWGIGALIGGADLAFWPLWLSAAIGAALGDWLSFWLGMHYRNEITGVWPLNRNPHLLKRGHQLFERWGVLAVFIGRFFGPLRAIVPLVAGMTTMPPLLFQIANWSSALLWAAVTLAPGAVGMSFLRL